MAAPTLSLFASLSTLLCCALPALLVTLGAGAAMAGLVTAVPGIVWLSAHKNVLFAAAGVLLLGSAFLKWRFRNAPCPADPAAARACTRLRRAGNVVLVASGAVYVIGGFFAYFAADLLL